MKTNRQIKYLIAVAAVIIIIAILGYITVSVNRSNGNPGNDSAADTKSNISGKQTDDLNKQVESFTLDDDLRMAITELAGSDEYLNKKSVTADEKHWKEQFISDFIQNSRLSFSYLDKISKENDGMVSVKELNYMQSSLTGVELDFSDIVDKAVDANRSSSKLNQGTLSNYVYESASDGIDLSAILDIESEPIGQDVWIAKRIVTVHLIKNPKSCFDGYTITSLTSTDLGNSTGEHQKDILKDERIKAFLLGNDIKSAIIKLATSNEYFNGKDIKVGEKVWKEQFVSDFIQNSGKSFSYLTKISKENNGMIDVKEINYMQKSLTGVELDFSDVVDKTVDIKQASDNLSSGTLSGYKYESVENGAVITGILDTGIKNEDEDPWSGRRKVKVYLVKNPESCFDAFTISSLSSINIEN